MFHRSLDWSRKAARRILMASYGNESTVHILMAKTLGNKTSMVNLHVFCNTMKSLSVSAQGLIKIQVNSAASYSAMAAVLLLMVAAPLLVAANPRTAESAGVLC